MARLIGTVLCFLLALATGAAAQRYRMGGPTMGMGNGMGMGMGGGMGSGGGCPAAMTMMPLLQNHLSISRSVSPTPTGVLSTTTSKDPAIADAIKAHVAAMRGLLEQCARGACPCRPHNWDPLFKAVYDNAAKIGMQVNNTAQGVSVKEDGLGEFAQKLVRAHANVVSSFVAEGHAAAMQAHYVT